MDPSGPYLHTRNPTYAPPLTPPILLSPKSVDSSSSISTTNFHYSLAASTVASSSSLSSTSSAHGAHFLYLPPGLGLSFNGTCQSRDDFRRSTLEDGPPSRKSSSTSSIRSSSTSSQRQRQSSVSYSSPPSSPGGSLPDHSSRRKECWGEPASGEEPALFLARRALWDEYPVTSSITSSVIITGAKVLDPEGEEEEDDEDEDEDDDEDDKVELSPIPSASYPSHATLSPRSSCLRPPLRDHPTPTPPSGGSSPSSSASGSSLLSSSVTFSDLPPKAVDTYSAEDYERGGDAPVEKLSMRDCVELRNLRDSVGIWSGRVPKWDPNGEEEGTGNNDSRRGSTEVKSRSESCTVLPCSGTVGVVTLCHSAIGSN